MDGHTFFWYDPHAGQSAVLRNCDIVRQLQDTVYSDYCQAVEKLLMKKSGFQYIVAMQSLRNNSVTARGSVWADECRK
jgi:hypothetical protein